MKLDWLADVHHDAGLTVIEHTGWKTRTMRDFNLFHPVGLIDHHTAGSAVIPNYPDPPFYRNAALENRCNITIRPDGVVVILNAGYAYDSGWGAPEVLSAVRNDRPLPRLSGLRSTTLGNAWFIDNEVQHLGNGDPIEPVQRDALIRSNAAICEHMRWDPRYRLIGHREWAPDRKVDPRWDGFSNPMPVIRTDTYDTMENDMDHKHNPMPSELPRGWADGTWEEWVARSGTKPESRGDTFYREDLGWVYAKVIAPLERKVASLEEQIAELEPSVGPSPGEIVDEIARRLGG